jgi:hypothetical protein
MKKSTRAILNSGKAPKRDKLFVNDADVVSLLMKRIDEQFVDMKVTLSKCTRCHWTGLSSNLRRELAGSFTEIQVCPKCGEHKLQTV